MRPPVTSASLSTSAFPAFFVIFSTSDAPRLDAMSCGDVPLFSTIKTLVLAKKVEEEEGRALRFIAAQVWSVCVGRVGRLGRGAA